LEGILISDGDEVKFKVFIGGIGLDGAQSPNLWQISNGQGDKVVAQDCDHHAPHSLINPQQFEF
jgi:hypothetical protein